MYSLKEIEIHRATETLIDIYTGLVRDILTDQSLTVVQRAETVVKAAKEFSTMVQEYGPPRHTGRPTNQEKAAERNFDPLITPYINMLRRRQAVGKKALAHIEAMRASPDPAVVALGDVLDGRVTD
jgi:hypothetical protein